MGFVGPNGAGKSTTLRIIMGLVHQDAGEVTVLGHPMPADQIAAKQHIGYVSEDMRLYPQQTLRFHMDFIRSIFDKWDDEYGARLLKRFELVADQAIKSLSHGQRVKATLLLVLARRPTLLVFDEPTTGLDPVGRREILEEIMQVLSDETRTTLFSSHNTLDVEQISDYITFIQNGRMIASQDKESFLERWRRIRLEVPDGFSVPRLPDVAEVMHSGHIASLTTSAYSPRVAATLASAGATVTSVEEIFVASVRPSKGATQ